MKISREKLQEIYAIVCNDWQNKIKSLLNANLFANEIEVPNNLILEAYSEAKEDKHTKWLKKNMPKPESINDKITSYEACCKLIGIKPLTLKQFGFLGEREGKRQFHLHRVTTGIKAINEGWYPDFENENESKYYTWFYNKKRGSRSGSSVGVFYGSFVVGDLYIQSSEKAEIIAKVFRDDYLEILF